MYPTVTLHCVVILAFSSYHFPIQHEKTGFYYHIICHIYIYTDLHTYSHVYCGQQWLDRDVLKCLTLVILCSIVLPACWIIPSLLRQAGQAICTESLSPDKDNPLLKYWTVPIMLMIVWNIRKTDVQGRR